MNRYDFTGHAPIIQPQTSTASALDADRYWEG
jgi:hypothetical protein